jgi:hypothetical protein
LTWLAARHPYTAGALAMGFVLLIIFLARLVIRALRALFEGAKQELTV